VKFGPLTKKLCAHMLTHPKSTLHVPSLSFPPIGLMVQGRLALGFASNF